MNEQTPATPPVPTASVPHVPSTRPKPVSLRTPAERYAHVAMRMKERGDIVWSVEQVAALEKKIKFCRQKLNHHEPYAPILPQLLSTEGHGRTQYWRVLIGGKPTTFAFSQICRGLVSFRGLGELRELFCPEEKPVEKPVSP